MKTTTVIGTLMATCVFVSSTVLNVSAQGSGSGGPTTDQLAARRAAAEAQMAQMQQEMEQAVSNAQAVAPSHAALSADQTTVQQAAFFSNNIALVSPWLHPPLNLPDGTPYTYENRTNYIAQQLVAGAQAIADQQDSLSQKLVQWSQQTGQPLEWPANGGTAHVIWENDHPVVLLPSGLASAQTIHADECWTATEYPVPEDYTGSQDLGIGMWDLGVAYRQNPELGNTYAGVFYSRVFDVNSDYADHATAVAGVILAAGNDPNAKGVAFAADLSSSDASTTSKPNKDMIEMQEPGWLVSNHSYNQACGWYQDGSGNWFWYGDTNVSGVVDWRFGAYTLSSAQYDQIVWTAQDFLPVWSAGNWRAYGPPPSGTSYTLPNDGFAVSTASRSANGDDGAYCSLDPDACAKNILTVGAIDGLPGGHVGAAGVAASPYSSFGPTGDGRIKPDVVAMGTSVYTTGYTSTYINGTGTSFAAPGAVGAVAIIQGLVDLFRLPYPLLSSTYKGLIIHTADSTTVGPNYQTGWGVVNAKAMLDLLTTNYSPQYENSLYELSYKNSLDHIKQIPLPNHGTISGPLPVEAGSTLKVTIAWTDPPASPETNGRSTSPLRVLSTIWTCESSPQMALPTILGS